MKILVFGDSHTIYFNINESMRGIDQNLRGVQSIVKTIIGGTISGFGKRDSKLNTLEQYEEIYEKERPDYIVFALGQVDLELGLYYRWFIKNEKPRLHNFFNELTESLIDKLNYLTEKYNLPKSSIILKGVNLSVLTLDRTLAIRYTSRIISENISNQEEAEKIKREMSLSFPSNLERQQHHTEFNKLLREKSIFAGYKYFDINDELIDTQTQQVKISYCPAKFDHHLVDSIEIRMIHMRKLMASIFS